MKIVNEYPPNYKEICKVFDIKDNPYVIFTYGDTCYNPGNGEMPQHLVTHEETHVRQQKAVGGPEEWWKRYLVDEQFRLEQETEAYRAQYSVIKRVRDWRYQEQHLNLIAGDLAGPMYGNILTKAEARAIITKPKKGK